MTDEAKLFKLSSEMMGLLKGELEVDDRVIILMHSATAGAVAIGGYDDDDPGEILADMLKFTQGVADEMGTSMKVISVSKQNGNDQ